MTFRNLFVTAPFLLLLLNGGQTPRVQAQQQEHHAESGGGGGLRRRLQEAASSCPQVKPVDNFDLDAYASKRWFVQEQQKTSYSDDSQTCVRAEYTVLDKKTWPWRYTVEVNNQEGLTNDNGRLCAYQVQEGTGQLSVAPCFLPKFLGGAYWVVAYEEDGDNGYALISGGQPTNLSDDGVTCATDTSYYNSGLWIFTRQQQRDEALVTKVKDIATSLGIDTSGLFAVDQTNC